MEPVKCVGSRVVVAWPESDGGGRKAVHGGRARGRTKEMAPEWERMGVSARMSFGGVRVIFRDRRWRRRGAEEGQRRKLGGGAVVPRGGGVGEGGKPE